MRSRSNDEYVDSDLPAELLRVEEWADDYDRYCTVTGRVLYPKDIYDDPSTRQVTLSIIEYTDLVRACELLGISLDSLASTWVREGVNRLFDRCTAALAGEPMPIQYPRLPDKEAMEQYVKEYDLPPLPRKWKRLTDLER